MEVDEVEDVGHVHVLQVGHDGVGGLRRGLSVDDDVLVAVREVEHVYRQLVLPVHDVGGVDEPFLVAEHDLRGAHLHVGARGSVLGAEELRPGGYLSRYGELARLVGVVEQGGEGVAGRCGAEPVRGGFLVGMPLADASLHPEGVAYGVELYAGVVEGMAAPAEIGGVDVQVDVLLGIRDVAVDVHGQAERQGQAEHAAQRFGRGDVGLQGEVVVPPGGVLADSGEGGQLVGHQSCEASVDGAQVVLAARVEACEGRLHVEVAFLALVVGADADVVETIRGVFRPQSQDTRAQVVDGCIECVPAQGEGVVALDRQIGVGVGDGCLPAEGLLVVVAVETYVTEVVAAVVESRHVALGEDVLHGAVDIDFGFHGSQLAVVEDAPNVHAPGLHVGLDSQPVLAAPQAHAARVGVDVSSGSEGVAVSLGLACEVEGAQARDFFG